MPPGVKRWNRKDEKYDSDLWSWQFFNLLRPCSIRDWHKYLGGLLRLPCPIDWSVSGKDTKTLISGLITQYKRENRLYMFLRHTPLFDSFTQNARNSETEMWEGRGWIFSQQTFCRLWIARKEALQILCLIMKANQSVGFANILPIQWTFWNQKSSH